MRFATGILGNVLIAGVNEMGDILPAVSLGTGLTATAIVCGDSFTCALLSNGQLKCWGGSRPPLSALLVHG